MTAPHPESFAMRLYYPSPVATCRHLCALPRARIDVRQHDDGRWMWAISMYTNLGGEGYAAMPKWGRFAPSAQAARAAAIVELRERLSMRSWSRHKQAQELLAWLDGLEAPQQRELFE